MEIWKDIKGYEGHYEVSSYGNVRAKYREFVGKDGKVKKYHPRDLKPDTSVLKRGYKRVTLSKDYITERFQVHRLVAEAFIPNPENKPFINHIDNNGLNNHIENLEWCTHSENMIHAQVQGRLFNSQSKGGKLGSKVNYDKAVLQINSLVGTMKDKWKILGVSNIRKNNKICIDVECTGCNRVFSYTKDYVLHNIGTACPKCRKRKSR